MGKKQKHFETIEAVKERIKDVPTEKLQQRLRSNGLGKAGAVAVREVLAERELLEKQSALQD